MATIQQRKLINRTRKATRILLIALFWFIFGAAVVTTLIYAF